MTTSHLYSLCSFLDRSVFRTKPMRCGNHVYSSGRPIRSAQRSASRFSNPFRFLCENGRLLGSAQTRKASRSSAAAGCASNAMASNTAKHFPKLCTSVFSLRPAGPQSAVSPGLLIGIKLIDEILDVGVLSPRRHHTDLAAIAVHDHIYKTLLIDGLY